MSDSTSGSAPSPCKAVCVLNTETGYCIGCYRTIEEIGGWMMMSVERKREVLREIEARRAAEKADGRQG
ncbi:MAG TPA: DUF1289 domain-containing protein [Alphaproteobacteria bacterium]|jgi:predicted Fe-S protein YdhL (DUF1289 family)|nr:DUF1289 domain-containing protein [Alphaproteobacteria bacterium]